METAEASGRLVNIAGRESNIAFLLPYQEVEKSWLECIRKAYDPGAVYDRFDHQITHTYPFRRSNARTRPAPRLVLRGVSALLRAIWHAGIRSDYRGRFWRTAWPCLKKRKIEELIKVAIVSHYLILFARDCESGVAEKCFYSEAPK